jgi:hypothetical protein
MKTILHASCLAILLGMGVSGGANAAVIQGGVYDGVDVGSVDQILGSTNALHDSSEATEMEWLQGLIPVALDGTTYKTALPVYYNTYGNTSVYAIHLDDVFGTDPAEPGGYFILKNTKAWVAFENLSKYSWAVFDTSDPFFPDMNIPNEGITISHIDQFGPSSGHDQPPVPLPASSLLALTGLGMMTMLASQGRRVKV